MAVSSSKQIYKTYSLYLHNQDQLKMTTFNIIDNEGNELNLSLRDTVDSLPNERYKYIHIEAVDQGEAIDIDVDTKEDALLLIAFLQSCVIQMDTAYEITAKQNMAIKIEV